MNRVITMLEALHQAVSLSTLIWLSLIVFVIHDLEEIIWVEPFLKKNRALLKKRLPQTIFNKLQGKLDMTSSQFGVAVLFEFLILIPIVYAAAEYDTYFLFIAFNAILLLHVFTHLGQSLVLRTYTPGVVSAVIVVLPFTLYLFYRFLSNGLVTWSLIIISIPVGLLVIPIILFGHRLGKSLV